MGRDNNDATKKVSADALKAIRQTAHDLNKVETEDTARASEEALELLKAADLVENSSTDNDSGELVPLDQRDTFDDLNVDAVRGAPAPQGGGLEADSEAGPSLGALLRAAQKARATGAAKAAVATGEAKSSETAVLEGHSSAVESPPEISNPWRPVVLLVACGGVLFGLVVVAHFLGLLPS